MRFHRSVSFLCHRRNNELRADCTSDSSGWDIAYLSGQTPSADTPGVVKLPADASIASALNKPKPAYPRLAKIARIQGSVVIQVNISATGSIEALKGSKRCSSAGSGRTGCSQELARRPDLVNGAPVAVRTTVNVRSLFDPKTGEPTVEAGVPDAAHCDARREIDRWAIKRSPHLQQTVAGLPGGDCRRFRCDAPTP